MPYVDWMYAPPEHTTDDIPWVINVLSDGTISVSCGSDELRVPRKVVEELIEMAQGALNSRAKRTKR